MTRFPHPAVTLSALAFVASQMHLFCMLRPLHPNIFAIQFCFTPDDFWRVVGQWGAAGMAVYRAHFTYDNLHPFIYGAFGYFLIAKTSLFQDARSSIRRFFQLALPVAGVFDVAENAVHLYLLAQQPGFVSPLVPLSAICSSIKWGLVAVFTLGVAVQTAVRLWATVSERPGRTEGRQDS